MTGSAFQAMDVVLGIASRREVFSEAKGEGFRGGEGEKSDRSEGWRMTGSAVSDGRCSVVVIA